MLNVWHIGPLSNGLNKTWICQESYFKRSVYLECSMRHTNHIQYLVWRVRACHASMTACRNSARLVGWLAPAFMVRVNSDHMFSIGFISGDTAGYFISSIPSVSMKLTTVRALWDLAVSSWYTKLGPNVRWTNGNNVSSRICRYWYWSRFPSTMWRSPFPS